ncbi:MAG: glycosyltransferase family 39 protein [Anaerolineales bacterium]|nr:glycosyltransferase family 39 protein [Anaerolineales bacterium]
MNSKRWLILILALGVLLRAVPAVLLGDSVVELPGTADQLSYHTLAVRVLEGHGFSMPAQWWPVTAAGAPTAHWSFLYTFYLWAVYGLFGVHPLIVRLLQAVAAGVLMPWLAYRIGKRAFGKAGDRGQGAGVELPALLAGAWVAVYPYFLYYAASLMTETFYITAILWSLDAALRIGKKSDEQGAGDRGQGIKLWLELGLALGITVLLRQVFLPFVPFLLLWLLLVTVKPLAGLKVKGFKVSRPKPGATQPANRLTFNQFIWRAALALAILAALIAPFTIYNYARFERFVLLNTNAGYAFFWSNHPVHGDKFVPLFTPEMPTYQELIPKELRQLDEAALERALMERGLQFVLDDPLRFLKLSFSRIPEHFIFWPKTDSGLISNLTRVSSIGLALPFMLAGGWLWFRAVRRKQLNWAPGSLLVLFMLVYVGMHLVSWAGIRYRLPTDATGLLFAAYTFSMLLKSFAKLFHQD